MKRKWHAMIRRVREGRQRNVSNVPSSVCLGGNMENKEKPLKNKFLAMKWFFVATFRLNLFRNSLTLKIYTYYYCLNDLCLNTEIISDPWLTLLSYKLSDGCYCQRLIPLHVGAVTCYEFIPFDCTCSSEVGHK